MSKVVIRVEIEKRELIAKFALAYKLLLDDIPVAISCRLFEDSVCFDDNDIILLNSAYENMSFLLKDLKSRFHKIYFMDEEALVIRSESEYLSRLSHDSMRYVDKILAVGHKHKNILKKKFVNIDTVVTGNPRVNILNSKFEELRLNDRECIKNKYDNYILIVSNFGTVNLKGSEIDFESRYKNKLDIFTKQGLINDDKDLLDFNLRFEHYESIFKSFIELVEKLSTLEKNIVVRIHPAEDSLIWKSVCSNYENVFINEDFDLNSVISCADLVIQNGCTSALESYFLGVPCVSYRPIVNEDYDQLFPASISKNVYNICDVLHYAENIPALDNYESVLRHNLSYSYEDDSIERIISIIKDDLSIETSVGFKKYYLFRHIKKRIKIFVLKIVHMLYDNKMSFFLPSKFKSNITAHREKIPDINISRLNDLFLVFDKIYQNQMSSKVIIKKIGVETFVFEKKSK